MIDVEATKRIAAAGDAGSPVVVTRRFLAQCAAELEAGRRAQAELLRRSA